MKYENQTMSALAEVTKWSLVLSLANADSQTAQLSVSQLLSLTQASNAEISPRKEAGQTA